MRAGDRRGTARPTKQPEPPRPGYRLVWHDEFDGTALDTAKWTAYAGPRRGAQNTPDAVAVADGVLTITTYTEDGVALHRLHRHGRQFLTTYGWFEARIRFESSPGEWGAFWLQSPTMGNPVGDVAAAGAEIDVVEHRFSDTADADISNSYGINLHWDGYGAAHRHAGGRGAPPAGAPPLQAGWHTYAVLWTPERYTFFLDGVAAVDEPGRRLAPPRVHQADVRGAGFIVGRACPSRRLWVARTEHDPDAGGLGAGLAAGAVALRSARRRSRAPRSRPRPARRCRARPSGDERRQPLSYCRSVSCARGPTGGTPRVRPGP